MPPRYCRQHRGPAVGGTEKIRAALVDWGFVSKQNKRHVNKQQRDKSAAPAAAPDSAPQSVLIGAGIATVQSIAVICFGIFLIVREAVGAENDSMVSDSGSGSFVGLGTAIFIFIVFGFVIAGSWAMVKGKRWGRGAVVLVELILGASAFQMYSGGSPVLGTITLLSAVAVLYLLMFRRESSEWAASNF
nr:hypothetical protein [Corynebacterium accolens]